MKSILATLVVALLVMLGGIAMAEDVPAAAAPKADAAKASASAPENVKATEKLTAAAGSLEVTVCSKSADDETVKMFVTELRPMLEKKSLPGDLRIAVTMEKGDSGSGNNPLGQSSWWQEWKGTYTLTDATGKQLDPVEFSARGESAVQSESTLRAMRDVADKVSLAVLKAAK